MITGCRIHPVLYSSSLSFSVQTDEGRQEPVSLVPRLHESGVRPHGPRMHWTNPGMQTRPLVFAVRCLLFACMAAVIF